MATTTISIDWPAIHAAATLCDAARRGTTIGNIHGVADVFGGSYFGANYERRGLAGLVALASSADTLAEQAWTIVHSGRRDIETALVVRDTDSGAWWCAMPDGSDRRASSRRGARWMATRHGGTSIRRPDGRDSHARRAHVVSRIRAAVEVAICIDALRRLLAATGVIEYRPAHQIAGVADGRINLIGLRWLGGAITESDTPPTIAEARAVVAALDAQVQS